MFCYDLIENKHSRDIRNFDVKNTLRNFWFHQMIKIFRTFIGK